MTRLRLEPAAEIRAQSVGTAFAEIREVLAWFGLHELESRAIEFADECDRAMRQ